MLETNGFLIINKFINPSVAYSLSKRFENIRDNSHIKHEISNDDKTKFGDSTIPTCYVGSTLPMFERLLLSLTEKMEKITEKSLFPTYSYGRIYYRDSILKRHIDRSSCEYSVTLCLSTDQVKWPICILDKNDIEHQVVQEPGDAIVYKGCEQLHWRNKFEGTSHSQLFLHYVDQNGPNAEYKFDKRSELKINL